MTNFNCKGCIKKAELIQADIRSLETDRDRKEFGSAERKEVEKLILKQKGMLQSLLKSTKEKLYWHSRVWYCQECGLVYDKEFNPSENNYNI